MTNLLAADATNRATRTCLQGLAYVVLLAVGLVVYNAFVDAKGWDDFDWRQLFFSAVQAGVMACFAYIMRRSLDPSKVPTPLPPEDPGEPNDDDQPHAMVIPNNPELPDPAEFYEPQRAKRDDEGNPIIS